MKNGLTVTDPGCRLPDHLPPGPDAACPPGELSRGASAVEWVIISAVVVAIVGVVAAIINAAASEGGQGRRLHQGRGRRHSNC